MVNRRGGGGTRPKARAAHPSFLMQCGPLESGGIGEPQARGPNPHSPGALALPGLLNGSRPYGTQG